MKMYHEEQLEYKRLVEQMQIIDQQNTAAASKLKQEIDGISELIQKRAEQRKLAIESATDQAKRRYLEKLEVDKARLLELEQKYESLKIMVNETKDKLNAEQLELQHKLDQDRESTKQTREAELQAIQSKLDEVTKKSNQQIAKLKRNHDVAKSRQVEELEVEEARLEELEKRVKELRNMDMTKRVAFSDVVQRFPESPMVDDQ